VAFGRERGVDGENDRVLGKRRLREAVGQTIHSSIIDTDEYLDVRLLPEIDRNLELGIER
jgi:hypothetical protein